MAAFRSWFPHLLAPLALTVAAAWAEEPAAETVPLPPEHPATSPTQPDHDTPVSARTPEDDAPLLTADTPVVRAGQKASFSLYGPETFLRGATGHFVVRDEYGRQLGKGDIRIADLPYSEGKPRQIQLALEHPLARQHTLEFSISRPEEKTVELSVPFIVQPGPATADANAPAVAPKWDGWLNLVSTPPASGNWDALRALGISGAVQYRLHPARREALRKGQALFYVENVSRQMLSRYQTEPGLWEKTLDAMVADASGRGPRSRDPSLCSQEFAESLAKELQRHAESYAKDPPLFYSLASEPSMTRLAAPADFDFSAPALAEFQRWLERDVYGTLPALNASWGTNFLAWPEVLPMTTDEARLRLNDGVMSFGPWVDFRNFQDFTFARIMRESGEYLRKTDPQAKAGITGAMGAFAFGGWDWSRLAQSLDVVEAYDIGQARALWRDLAPGKPALAVIQPPPDDTVAPASPLAENLAEVSRTLWSFALEGGPRGAVVWNDEAGTEARTTALGPLLKTLGGDTGTILAHCKRLNDGVAVLYSPASIRLTWLLEADHFHGAKWLDAWARDTSGERRESLQLRLRESWCKLLDDAGISWTFLSSAQIEKREILNKELGIKVLVLPRALCISDLELDILKQFVQGGGKLIADACCGRFDEHGRLRKKPALDELFGIDSSAEPFFAEPMNPLEPLKAQKDAAIDGIDELAPVFSDKIKADGASTSRAEYRGAPVLKTTAAGAFLNLDLTDYLRWRLHPDRRRARVTLDSIVSTALKERRDASLIDWEASKLPVGTRVVQLQFGDPTPNPSPLTGRGAGARIVALMRNPQSRLHEMGTEGEGNWAFEKPEPFTLALRQPLIVRRIFSADNAAVAAPSRTIDGTLDPNTPALLCVQTGDAKPPELAASEKVKSGEMAEVKLGTAGAAARLYAIVVKGPDGAERAYYGKTIYASDGGATYAFPTALNDPAGAWTIAARDVLTGAEATRTMTVLEAALEPKP